MKKIINTALIAVAILFLFSCSSRQLILPQFDAQGFDKELYESKVDNFIIIFDASSSMNELSEGNQKFGIGQAVIQRMTQLIPELGQNAALRSVGHSATVSDKSTELFYGMGTYNSDAFAQSVQKITEAGGLTPMNIAFDYTKNDIGSAAGASSTAVIIISDGELDMERTLNAAQALKDAFGESICFYPVQAGNSANGKFVMQEIAKIGGCGFYSEANDILSGEGMAEFVEKVFLKKKEVKLIVNRDSDNDGILDDADRCLNTPEGARVNAEGCWVLNDILFDTDSFELTEDAHFILDEVVSVMEKNPDLRIGIYGYTDNIGDFGYNVKLSHNRAQSVKQYIISKGIEGTRVFAKGFGPENPAASNTTEEGRAKNRRVEILNSMETRK